MSDCCPDKKVYTAGGGQFSMHDLMRRFADPELEFDGMPRVSDLHLKVGEPVRYHYDGDLETVEGGDVLTDSLIQ
ncbi:MAG: twitching motility protein PilT [Lentimonas sp.]|jgi:twitching motility protein PilT